MVSTAKRMVKTNIITLSEICNIHGSILCTEAALSYHGICNYNLVNNPLFFVRTTKEEDNWKLVRGVPSIIKVTHMPSVFDMDICKYGCYVTKPLDSVLDTIEFNKYSEFITQALTWLSKEDKVLLFEKAAERGLVDVLNWEYSEIDAYMDY